MFPTKKKPLGQVRDERVNETQGGVWGSTNWDDLGSNQKAIRALGLMPIAAFSNHFSSFGRGNILPKGSAHRVKSFYQGHFHL